MIYNTQIDISGGVAGEFTSAFLPIDQDIVLTKGSDFLWRIVVSVPEQGLGWNATHTVNLVRMQWRTAIDSASTVLNATTPSTYITLNTDDPANVIILVDIPASATDDIVFGAATLDNNQGSFRRGGQGYYDMEIVLATSGRVFRILEGSVTTSDEVTR